MDTAMSQQIGHLQSLSRKQLLDMWRLLYRRAATGIRRELLVPFLAYRMQEHAYGGLSGSTRAELRRIARGLEKPASSRKLTLRPPMKPGTRLLRQWHGKTHEVFVTEAGYEFRGVRHRSLSEIARKITGTRWSGPAFFGSRKITSTVSGRRDG